MRLKDPSDQSKHKNSSNPLYKGFYFLKNHFLFFIFFSFFSGAGSYWIYSHYKDWARSLSNITTLWQRKWDARDVEVKTISINIKPKHLKKLRQKRFDALKLNRLISAPDDFVKAKLHFEDKKIPIQVRLKGDTVTDHLKGEKWSFRIKCDKDETILGMNRFSLQHPARRDYLYEWVYHRMLKRENLLGLRYDFVKLMINGKDLGIYAIEEHFDKRFVENNQRREGPIVRWREDELWSKNRLWDEEAFASFEGNFQLFRCEMYLSSQTDVFQGNTYLSDPQFRQQTLKGMQLLEHFRQGQLTTSEVFDVDQLATFMALTDLTGGLHGIEWRNSRFYYNPITSKLEPVGYDAQSEGRKINSLIPTFKNSHTFRSVYWDSVFSDQNFVDAYLKQLEKVSQPNYLSSIFNDLKQEIDKNLKIIHSEFPEYNPKINLFQVNADYIRKVTHPKNAFIAYQDKATQRSIDLHIANIQQLPVEILGVQWDDKWLPLSEPYRIDSKWIMTPLAYHNISIPLPPKLQNIPLPEKLTVKGQIPGVKRIISQEIQPWSPISRSLVETDLTRMDEDLLQWKFLKVNKQEKVIKIRPGFWEINRPLLIPKGYQVIATEDTELYLVDDGTILSHSPLEWIGSEEKPIVIKSETHGGLAVIQAHDESHLQNVHFYSLSIPKLSSPHLTGAVTFYESPLEAKNCFFYNSRCEDALNTIRSDFSLISCTFSNSRSDAFDADFCQGSLINCLFQNSGNDAIDCSGSVVECQETQIKHSGDKAISIGEKSTVNAYQTFIENATIGVAAKDSSIMQANDLKISKTKIGLALYVKKSEFDSSLIRAGKLSLENTEFYNHLIEEGSSLIIDGKQVKEAHQNVNQIIENLEEKKTIPKPSSKDQSQISWLQRIFSK